MSDEPLALNSSHVLVLADVLHVENNATGTLGGNLVNRSIWRWSGTRGFMDSTSGKELPQTFPVPFKNAKKMRTGLAFAHRL